MKALVRNAERAKEVLGEQPKLQASSEPHPETALNIYHLLMGTLLLSSASGVHR